MSLKNVVEINWDLPEVDLILQIQQSISSGKKVVTKGEKEYSSLEALSKNDVFLESGLEVLCYHCPRELEVVRKGG